MAYAYTYASLNVLIFQWHANRLRVTSIAPMVGKKTRTDVISAHAKPRRTPLNSGKVVMKWTDLIVECIIFPVLYKSVLFPTNIGRGKSSSRKNTFLLTLAYWRYNFSFFQDPIKSVAGLKIIQSPPVCCRRQKIIHCSRIHLTDV